MAIGPLGDTSGGYKRYWYGHDGCMLPFGILYPKNYTSDPTNSGNGYPLIVMLDGSDNYGYLNTSQFGTDVDIMNNNTSYRYNNFDCFVLLPEWFGACPWVNPDWPEGESDPETNPMLNSDSEDRKSTRLNSSHIPLSRMPSSA